MDKKEPNKIIGVDAFRQRKAEQLIQKLEYSRIDEEDFTIGNVGKYTRSFGTTWWIVF